MFFRKFFEVDAPETVSAPSVNIAELMAKQGTKTDDIQTAVKPIDITAPVAEAPKPTDVTPAVPATEASATAQSPATQSQNPPPQEQKTEPQPTPQIAEAPKVEVPTWQAVLKQQPDAVFKELGYDERTVSLLNAVKEKPEMLAFYDRWVKGEDLTSYLRELTTDYTKMPAEEVMRHQLQREYPKANARQLDLLFNEKVIKAYGLNSDDEETLERGKLLLEAEADRHRDVFAENQKGYLFPKPPEPKAQVDANLAAQQQQDQQRQEFDAYKGTVSADPFTQKLRSTNQLTFGQGDEAFNFPVDSNGLLDILFDSDKWSQEMFQVQDTPQGKKFIPDVEKQLLVAAVTKYGKGFLDKYAEHYKALGAKAAIAPIDNAKVPEGTQPARADVIPTNPAGAMAKMGTRVDGY